jgi:DNA-nicking Smr family endonuclease
MGHKDRKRRPSRENGAAGGKPFPKVELQVEEELDLHGLAIDEAMVQVQLALARWRNRPGACLRIIHGHSTGTRESIKGMLRRNLEGQWRSQVRVFRQEPGNPGATLVFLAG